MKQCDDKIQNCEVIQIHEDVVERVSKLIPPDKTLYDLADFFKVFADSSRIKILYALMNAEMCVCDLASALGMSQSAISHQLRVLKQQDLVRYRKDGKSVFYTLSDDHIRTIMCQGFNHITEP